MFWCERDEVLRDSPSVLRSCTNAPSSLSRGPCAAGAQPGLARPATLLGPHPVTWFKHIVAEGKKVDAEDKDNSDSHKWGAERWRRLESLF